MSTFIEGLIITVALLVAFQVFARWHAVRDDRRQRLLEESWAIYRASRAISERLTKIDPQNANWQRDIGVSHLKIGELQSKLGDLPTALENYQASHAIADRLAKIDPRRAEWQRDLSVVQEKIGDLFATQGKMPAALEIYRASLSIRERLVEVDQGHVGWQRSGHARSHHRRLPGRR